MPPYKESDIPPGIFLGKFVRVNRELFIVSTKGEDVNHGALARMGGVYDEVERLKKEGQAHMDAGFVAVIGDEIELKSDSSTLRVPLVVEAREESFDVFQEQSPNHTVKRESQFGVWQDGRRKDVEI